MAKPVGKPAYDYMVKILIIGDSAVGKTCLLTRFCEGSISGTHIATIGIDFKIKTVDVEGKRVKLQIWDTAGQEKYRSIVQTYYKGAVGIILVYSVNDRKSFQNVDSWMKQIKANAAENVVVTLIANKCDVSDRQVDRTEGQRMADQYGITFYETSAKDGTGVNESFVDIARQIKDNFGDETGGKSGPTNQGTTGGQKLQNNTNESGAETEGKSGCRC